MQGKLEKAMQFYKQASLADPEDYQSPILLATVYKELNLEEEAKKASRLGAEIAGRHLELNPDDPRAYYLGAGALLAIGNKDKSLEWANKALSLRPDGIGVLYNIACLFCSLGRTEEAIEYLERASLKGYAMKKWLEKDSELNPIRNHPRFQALLKKLK
jgi:tetratricopeptide (TPR) repeat protein